jgi:hypothetical protein
MNATINHDVMAFVRRTLTTSWSTLASTMNKIWRPRAASSKQSFPNLIVERLYYAEGRQHPDHPLHGLQIGLARW